MHSRGGATPSSCTGRTGCAAEHAFTGKRVSMHSQVRSFLEENALSLIIRAHECVMDGFQRFAGGKLITVFSATNYCNRWANAGAILLVGKDLEIVPKMIFPVEDLDDGWLRADEQQRGDEHLRDMRPPTPPRDGEHADADVEPPAEMKPPTPPRPAAGDMRPPTPPRGGRSPPKPPKLEE